jgi:hypothetical protein
MYIRFKSVAWILIATYAMIPIGGHAFTSKVLFPGTDAHEIVDGSTGVHCATGAEGSSLPIQVTYLGDHHLTSSDGHRADCVDILISPANDLDCVALVSEIDCTSELSGLVPPCSDVSVAVNAPGTSVSMSKSVVLNQRPNHLVFLSSVVLIV